MQYYAQDNTTSMTQRKTILPSTGPGEHRVLVRVLGDTLSETGCIYFIIVGGGNTSYIYNMLLKTNDLLVKGPLTNKLT